MVSMDDLPRKAQPQAETVRGRGPVHAIKPVKHPRLVGGGNAGTGVAEGQQSLAAIGGERHRHGAPGLAVFHGVPEQVEDRHL